MRSGFKSPLVFLALSSVCNIVLDLYFVTKLKMGVAGAALATDISQAISVVVSFLWLCTRMKKMKTQQKSRIFDLHILEIVCNVAVPSMLQQSMVSIGIFLVQRLVNGYGEAVMAGYAAATKIDSIAILPMVNVGNAVSTFTAQNIGGKKPERVKEGFRAGLLMSAVIGVIVTGILLVYAKVFVGLFMDSSSNQAAIATGIEYLRVVGLFSRRGYNIQSLTVSETEDPRFSRMTIVSEAAPVTFRQMEKQLLKLEDVVKVIRLEEDHLIASELALVKVRSLNKDRPAVLRTISKHGARVKDIGHRTITAELTGATDRIDSFIEDMALHGIVEMSRSGMTALESGDEGIRDHEVAISSHSGT